MVILYQHYVERMFVNFERIADALLQMINRFVTFNRKVVQNASFARIERNPEELLLDQSYLGDGQRDIHVWFKGHRDAVAVGTLDSGLVQAVHHIDDHRLISLEMIFP